MNETDIQKLVKILNELRVKCPWDKKQTIHTLRQQSIEELYELTDAIDGEDWMGMKEELGDLLLHIVFYSKIAEEKKRFNLQEVIDGISEKLIRRHPHIYGDVVLEDAEAVKKNWEKLKLAEGKKSIMSGVPSSLPSLVKAMRIQQKAAQTGFDWKNADDVWKKVMEEKKSAIKKLSEMPDEDLLSLVELQIDDTEIPGIPHHIVTCSVCGEHVMDKKEIIVDDKPVCQFCAD
jgi:XTP/dITP diphosphohydrolase